MDARDEVDGGAAGQRTRLRALVVLDAFWPGRRPYLFDGWCRRS